jgi:hypothetical protein
MSGAQSGSASSTQNLSTQNSITATTQTDTQVNTFVQQVDLQGPVVVERISTQFAEVACTPANARLLVEGLHNGTAVTLNIEGKTATFTPTVKLGYGEAYITLAMAAEALRNAGVTGCATPEQWQAVLLGGPLAASGSTSTTVTASSTTRFPGILTLRSQGQGWGQIAQTTHVQLGQVMSSARTSLNINSSNAANSNSSSRSESNLTPTGRSSSEFNPPRSSRDMDHITPGTSSSGSSLDRKSTDTDSTDRSSTDRTSTMSPSTSSPSSSSSTSTSSTPSTNSSSSSSSRPSR